MTAWAPPALLRLLSDASRGKFDAMICVDIDRFGRDLTDILINRRTLAQCGVEDHFTSSPNESRLGQNVRAVISEEERLNIKDRTLRGRLKALKDGVPQGRRPFNRKYDKETKKWSFVDERINKLIKEAAKQYLQGKSMGDITSYLNNEGFKISTSNLYNVFKRGCGTRYTNTLKGFIDGEEIDVSHPHTIPRILPERMIEAIRNRMARRAYNRDKLKRYVLNNFIFCADCGKALTGATPDGYKYYTHPQRKDQKCRPGYKQLPGPGIENAVFNALYRHTFDVESYREAVRQRID